MLLAHPVTEAATLGVAPAFVALVVVNLVLLVDAGVRRVRGAGAAADISAAVPTAAPAAAAPSTAASSTATSTTAGAAGRTVGLVVARAVGAALMVLAVVAGRAGDPDQLDNLAPALVIGFGWPALLALTALGLRPWAWGNPFDALAAPLAGGPGGDRAGGDRVGRVGWLAVAGALGWVWWLGGFGGTLEPRAIGAALAGYALVVVALAVALGRAAIAEAEVFTVAFDAVDRARRGAPLALSPAHRTALAVLVGGLAFVELRVSRWYVGDLVSLGLEPLATPASLVGTLLAAGISVSALAALRRWALRTRGADALDAVLPWLVVGLGLSAAVERDRLWTSAQLVWAWLRGLGGAGPGGGATALLGTGDARVLLWPYDDVGRLVVQLVLLVVPVLVGLVRATAQDRTQASQAAPARALVLGWLLLAVTSAATL